MGKRIFWIFLLVVALATAAGVIYVQSEHFARIVKSRIQEKVAATGVYLGFERVSIGVLPPSVSLVNVDLKVLDPANGFGLSTDTVFKAGSLGFSFQMIQAFGSGIAVNKVFVSNGEIKLRLPSSTSSGGGGEKLSELVHKPLRIQITERFHATIRQIEWRDTTVDLSWPEGKGDARFTAGLIGYLAVTPSSEGTNLVINAQDLALDTAKLKEGLKTIKLNADVQRNLVAISSLDAQRREAALHASGRLVGSIDSIGESRADLAVILRGPFSELADFDTSLAGLGGELIADLKVSGRIAHPSIQGKAEARGFEHGLWKIERVEAGGSYEPGKVVLDSLSARSGGGRIFLKEKVELSLPVRSEPLSLVLGLENAAFEEFAGDVRKSVNSLKMLVDGSVLARIEIAESGGKQRLGGIQLRPELAVKDLELNNQVYGKTRPYRRIFKLTPFSLSGNVQIKGGGVAVSGAKLAFASGVLDVAGTVGKEGFDLGGKAESVNLGAEAGEISGIPLRGEGAFAIRVHGPSDKVKIDFDVKQKGAKFVNFDFGEIEGRVTYDDDKNLIRITNVRAAKGSASYKVDGTVDLGDSEAISLDAEFADSAPDDIFAVFAHQLREISWIPHGMGGVIRGKAKVGGTYTDGLSTLEIDARLSGRNLTYKGETVHELETHAGVSKAIAFARDVRVKKYDTAYRGFIDFDTRTSELRYELEAGRGKLRSLDFLGSSGVPLDGIYTMRSEGQGRWETLVSKSRFDITNAFVRTRAMPPVSLALDTTAEGSAFSARVGDSASLTGKIARSSKGDSHAHLSVTRADLDFLLCVVSRSNCNDPALSLAVTAESKLSWKGGDWQAMSGTGSLQELQVAKTGYSLRLDRPLSVHVANGVAEAGQGTLVGEESRVGFRLKGRVDGESIENSVNGTASLKLLELITPLVEEARGRLRLDVGLRGSLRDASLRGRVSIEEGALRIRGLDAPVDNLEARFRLAESAVSIESFTGQLGGGTLQASGGLDLYLNRPPRFAVDLFLANSRMRFPFVTYAEFSEAKLSFTGEGPPYLFSGTARAKRVVMHDNFDVGAGQKSLQNARYLPEKVAGARSFYEIRIRALADSGIFV